MQELQEIEHKIIQNKNQLQYLKFEECNNEHIVTLIDEVGYEIIRGYGQTIIEAINDLHSNLI